MNVLVLGGDGYIGWPLAMRLAKRGHKVAVFDSLVKRKWQMESGAEPLFEVLPLHRRIKRFSEVTGCDIEMHIGDLTNVGAIYHIFDLFKPDAVYFCAGQPSAPFSMQNRTNAVTTHENSLIGLMNALFAVQRSDQKIHFIRIGAAGLRTACNGEPGRRGSFHHLAQSAGTDMLAFSAANWGLTATELRPGIIYGFETDETALDPALCTAFHYDAVFGTAANRFGVQAAIGLPLTVYGDGGRMRAFTALPDIVAAAAAALDHPREPGRVYTADHYGEIATIRDAADLIRACAETAGLRAETGRIDNPRTEAGAAFAFAEDGPAMFADCPAGKLEDTFTRDFFMAVIREKDRIDPAAMERYIPWRRH